MSLLKLYDSFFNDPFFGLEPAFQTKFTPIYSDLKSKYNAETGEARLWIEAPGFSKDEISIESEGNKIILSGKIKREEVIEKIGVKEFYHVLYQRDLDPESLSAGLKDGILEVQFKTKRTKKLKKVDVKVLE